MARVALVTGGTRGIGAAISKALKAAGYKVAATYAGNDAAAEKFKADTGIPVFKWDVSSFDACADGVKKVEAELGPVDVLVNNAGITKDGAFHKMTLEQWNAVINTNLGSLFNMTRQVIEGMRARKLGRRYRLHQGAGAGDRARRHHRERDLPGLYQHRNGAGGAEGCAGEKHPAADSGQPPRRARGNRPRRGLPRIR
jgi:NAD(P)-dependent dehydrogenase (short-subunit alcohol dehydrogenase family)